ncbi:chorismate synthase [Oceanirhabdus sp. W0125-5]|uniref:chorismate synthase n=1 Tax=Oceanirhabdus sp. W0125-5 TaxID=2999116 RepID=UPI0022F2EC65|nr:chorismate synthase [Oceanirhabdus sp. W0125-5]WBW99351.1 chorismate synthase [Oceanirhabdus sp. W0125-5]
MSGSWGKNYRVTIYGESHGTGVGIIIDGLPGGIEFPYEYINKELYRRKPGKNRFTTGRQEEDNFKVLSGIFEGYTTGTPINLFIENKDKRSRDYSEIKNKMRPGHADYSGYQKYFGYNDYRGGGHFSGRLTAALVMAGAFARKILENMDIHIISHIAQIGDIKDNIFSQEEINDEIFLRLKDHENQFPIINEDIKEAMMSEIIKAKEDNDSVGGVIESLVLNVKPGVGNPFFNSVESSISSMLFSIPAVKGVEFGEGFGFAHMRGSQSNDEMRVVDNKIITLTNNNGGVTGGITNGMPIVFRTAIKPTPSIGKEQLTADISKMENTVLNITGRHDPCIIPRALPVIDNATAIAILDLVLERIKEDEGFKAFKRRD